MIFSLNPMLTCTRNVNSVKSQSQLVPGAGQSVVASDDPARPAHDGFRRSTDAARYPAACVSIISILSDSVINNLPQIILTFTQRVISNVF